MDQEEWVGYRWEREQAERQQLAGGGGAGAAFCLIEIVGRGLKDRCVGDGSAPCIGNVHQLLSYGGRFGFLVSE